MKDTAAEPKTATRTHQEAMNYRHIYHAGNFADVVKHAILCLILEHLRAKQAPFFVLDTHAGIGLYDLSADQAQRTAEFQSGILRLFPSADPPDETAPLIDIVRSLNPGEDAIRWYPGSPRIARALLRPQDRMTLVELHPEDVGTLRDAFRGDRQVAVRRMDAYAALKANLPPKEKRGLVLIDPPFEQANEFDRMIDGLRMAHKRWPNGIYALWYPIKERPAIWRFHDALERTGIRRILAAELMIHPEDTHLRLNGSGMIIINPPWRLDEKLGRLLPALRERLQATSGDCRVEWIVPE